MILSLKQRFLGAFCQGMLVIALGFSVAAHMTTAQAAPRPMIYTGMVAPGTGGLLFSNTLSTYPPIARGDSIIIPYETANGNAGLWRWQNGTLSKIIYRGEILPGGSAYQGTAEYAVDDTGRAAFVAIGGTYLENSSFQLVKAAGFNTPAPGTAGNFGSMQDLNFRNGELSFRAQITGGASGFGIWRSDGVTLNPGIFNGQLMANSSRVHSTYSFAPPANGPNSTIIRGEAAEAGQFAILKQTGNQAPVAVVQRNESAPGLLNETFVTFQDPASNKSGQYVFRAGLTNGSVHNALFRDLGNGPQFVIGNGSPMPGLAGTELTIFSEPVINDSGTIAFSGYLGGTAPILGYGGIWTVNPMGVVSEVVRERQTAVPDVPGVWFDNLNGAKFAMNSTGQVAWLTNLEGPGIGITNDSGLWATMPDGRVTKIVREGDMVEVSPGVFRKVAIIGFGNNPTDNGGVNSPWTDTQQLVYTLTFSDSSKGVFVSAVPEPGTIGLTICVLTVFGWTLQKRRAATLTK